MRASGPISYRHHKGTLIQNTSKIYKTHMQSAHGRGGFWRTGRQLHRRAGIKRFYRGAVPIAIGCIPAHGAFFATYEAAKSKLLAHDGVSKPILKQSIEISLVRRVYRRRNSHHNARFYTHSYGWYTFSLEISIC